MKFLFLVLVLLLSGCSLLKETPPLHDGRHSLVFEDQYIIEAKGQWCPWVPGVTSCPKVFPPGEFVALQDEYQPLQLVTGKDLLQVLGTARIVPYNVEDDMCQDVSHDFNCTPNYVLQASEEVCASAVPNDRYLSSLWGMNTTYGIRAPKAWNVRRNADNVVVAILDSGIDVTHPDLASNVWKTWNAIDNTENIRDGNGHGTHVAGTACAVGNNSIGVVGVAWKCKLFGIKFLGDNGSGSLYDAVKGIEKVTEVARLNPTLRFVINASFGGGGYSYSMQNALARANASGVMFVAAAGNEASDNDVRPSYPASYDQPNVISVAALTKDGKLAYFSNYGKTSVDLAAPGYDIYSTYPGNRYTSLSGTSMAAPHVTGAAALLLAHEPALTTGKVKERLLATGLPVPALTGKVVSHRTLNIFESLRCQ